MAFLPGINTGNRRVKNDALRLCCEEMGFLDVAIFRASGNVILGTERKNDPGKVTRRLEGELEDSFGYEVVVLLRTEAQVRAIARHEPFDAAQLKASTGKVQVSLLAKAPSAAARKQVLSLATAEDRLALRGRELFWLPSGGISESELDLKAIGTALGLSTMRTKGTIDQIAAKHFAG